MLGSLLGCGARTELDLANRLHPTGPGPGGAGAGGAGGEGGQGGSPLPLCHLTAPSEPLELVTFADMHAAAPALAVVDPGSVADGSGPRSARVALEVYPSGGTAMESDLQVLLARIDPGWPTGVAVEQPLAAWGPCAHGWGELARASGGDSRIGLAWAGDPPYMGVMRPLFRPFDVASWTPGTMVDLAAQGEAVLDLAAGAAIDPAAGGYAGSGYATVWRDVAYDEPDVPTRPVVAVIGEAGSVLLGPLPLAPPEPYPGTSPSLAWTGTTYLAAVSFVECAGTDPFCAPRSIIVARLRAPSSASGEGGLEVAATLPAESFGAPGRPALAARQGEVWVAWTEGDPEAPDAPRSLYLAALDPTGVPTGPARLLADGIRFATRPTIDLSGLGLSLVWSDGDAPTDEGRIGVLHLADAQSEPTLLTLTTTAPGSYQWPSGVGLDYPRGLLLTWSGRRTEPPPEPVATFLGWIACVEEER